MDAAYKLEIQEFGFGDSEMNPEIKADWLNALRSGKYRQGMSALRRKRTNSYVYCCLGVLCERVNPSAWDGESHDKVTGFPSVAFAREVGLASNDGAFFVTPGLIERFPRLAYSYPEYRSGSLAELNDSGNWSFNEIADLIEYTH